jgi:hypothetical protein
METAMNELSSEAKALIRSVGTADGPRATDRARVKQRLVASLAGVGTVLSGGSLAVASAPAVAAKVTIGSVAIWFAVGAGLGTAVSTPAVVSAYRRSEAASAPSSAVASGAPVVRPSEARRAAAVLRAEPAPAAEHVVPPVSDGVIATSPDSAPRIARIVTPVERTPAGAGDARTVPPEAAQGLTPVGATSLAEETRLLHAAQRELASKHAVAALELLDEHAVRFPGGALAEERSAARVLALCALGRSAEARRVAEAFVSSSPQSPLVPRLRGSCALSRPKASDDRQ